MMSGSDSRPASSSCRETSCCRLCWSDCFHGAGDYSSVTEYDAVCATDSPDDCSALRPARCCCACRRAAAVRGPPAPVWRGPTLSRISCWPKSLSSEATIADSCHRVPERCPRVRRYCRTHSRRLNLSLRCHRFRCSRAGRRRALARTGAAASVLLHGYLARLYTRFDRRDEAWESLQMALGPEDESNADQDFAPAGRRSGRGSTPGARPCSGASMRPTRAPAASRAPSRNSKCRTAIWTVRSSWPRETLSLRPDWNDTRVWLRATCCCLQGQRSTAFEQYGLCAGNDPGAGVRTRVRESAGRPRTSCRKPPTGLSVSQNAIRASECHCAGRGGSLFVQAGELDNAEAIYLQLLTSGSSALASVTGILVPSRSSVKIMQARSICFVRYRRRASVLPAALFAISQSYELLGDTRRALAVLEQFC